MTTDALGKSKRAGSKPAASDGKGTPSNKNNRKSAAQGTASSEKETR